ncbi:MAG: diguanylate cyclase [Alphaproteobacteria bacterium]|nr:diguanylate cyclase [Alphaproteobacteria bacterium]
MLIRELLDQTDPGTVKCIRPDRTLYELAAELRAHNIGAMLVTDGNDTLVGMVSERDLVRAITEFGEGFGSRSVTDVITRDVITCAPGDNVIDTLAVMNDKRIRHIPVLDTGKPLAMISIREFEHICTQLRIQSRTDFLTGLSNRRYFMETLEAELARGKRYGIPLSLAILDIDHFKHINDTFGHGAGDRVLYDLANLLVHELRNFDVVGRLGGEEFAILFPNTSAPQAELACERLITAIRAQEIVTDEGTIRFTVSFGLTDAAVSVPDGRAFLQAADQLLYRAKNEGRNRLVAARSNQQFDPTVTTDGSRICNTRPSRQMA